MSLTHCFIFLLFNFFISIFTFFVRPSDNDEDDNDDDRREETMTTEERMKYVERVLVCKRYFVEATVIVEKQDSCKAMAIHSTCDESSTGDAEAVQHKRDLVQQAQKQHQPQSPLKTSPQCAICLEQFMDGDMIVESSSINADCTHVFHKNCIHEWCMVQTNCPCCRRELLFINSINNLDESDDENRTLPNDSFRSTP